VDVAMGTDYACGENCQLKFSVWAHRNYAIVGA
jgi:hypothetical protein